MMKNLPIDCDLDYDRLQPTIDCLLVFLSNRSWQG
jgi:hypothetical protein